MILNIVKYERTIESQDMKLSYFKLLKADADGFVSGLRLLEKQGVHDCNIITYQVDAISIDYSKEYVKFDSERIHISKLLKSSKGKILDDCRINIQRYLKCYLKNN